MTRVRLAAGTVVDVAEGEASALVAAGIGQRVEDAPTDPVAQWVDELRIAGMRPATIEDRSGLLRRFARQVAPRSVLAATREDVMALVATGKAAQSRRSYLSGLRSFFRWALDQGLVEVDPTAKIPTVKVRRGTPRPVTEDQLQRALEAANPRMRAWLLLMALAGLRCLEVAALRPEDVQLEPVPLLRLRETKGGRPATVPAHPEVLRALSVLPVSTDDGSWWQATPGHVSRTVSEYLRAVGVPATGHQLRHYAGTSWYRASGHDLLTTQQLLRHASVASTMIYAATDPTRPAAVVDAVASPFEQAAGRPHLRAVGQ